MAQVQLQPVGTGKSRRPSRASLKIDMTPMVDLGFLLITFFMFTTTMSEPTATKLYMPAHGQEGTIGETNSLTVLLGKENKVHYYHGKWEDAIKTNSIETTNYDVLNGIGKIIREKQKALREKRNELTLMIKPLEHSSYKNFVDALDEVTINALTRYVIMDVSPEEIGYFAKR